MPYFGLVWDNGQVKRRTEVPTVKPGIAIRDSQVFWTWGIPVHALVADINWFNQVYKLPY